MRLLQNSLFSNRRRRVIGSSLPREERFEFVVFSDSMPKLIEQNSDRSHKLAKKLVEKLFRKSEDPSEFVPLIPFPGIGAQFVYDKKSGGGTNHLFFHSATPGSLFYRMSVFRYYDGDVAIRLSFRPENAKKVEAYLIANKLTVDERGLARINEGEYTSEGIEDLQKLYKILISFNKIESHSLLIAILVRLGKWKEIDRSQGARIWKLRAYL